MKHMENNKEETDQNNGLVQVNCPNCNLENTVLLVLVWLVYSPILYDAICFEMIFLIKVGGVRASYGHQIWCRCRPYHTILILDVRYEGLLWGRHFYQIQNGHQMSWNWIVFKWKGLEYWNSVQLNGLQVWEIWFWC